MNGEIWGIARGDSLSFLKKSQHRVSAFTNFKFLSREDQDNSYLESNLQGALAQQQRVSELRFCSCGR